jgi:hypothetical protein
MKEIKLEEVSVNNLHFVGPSLYILVVYLPSFRKILVLEIKETLEEVCAHHIRRLLSCHCVT